MHDIGTTLRLTRKARKLTQRQVAKLAGISQPQLSRFEAGEEVQLSTANQIADALDMNMVALPKKLMPYIEGLIATNSQEVQNQSDDLLTRYHIEDD